ncbi:MAG TPA: AmmeMemoRadiSam system protein B [Patescibacteria group bacterium]|nr:AmmeMemoRadiSam system protein B [Patescibacteria group bacterium]
MFPSTEVIQTAWSARKEWSVSSTARVLLVPHHLVAGHLIASAFISIPAPSTVYLLFPDHFSRVPKGMIGITNRPLESDTVRLQNSTRLDQFASAGLNSVMLTDGMQNELSFQALIPFIVKAWPEVRVVPIMIGSNAPISTQEALASVLSKVLTDPKTLVVASADFAHHVSPEAADKEDRLSEQVIDHLDVNRVDEIQADAKGVLGVVLRIAQQCPFQPQLLAHTNSVRLLHITDPVMRNDSTSHFIYNFFQP